MCVFHINMLIEVGPISFQTGGGDEARSLIKGFRKTTQKEKQIVTRSKVILCYTTQLFSPSCRSSPPGSSLACSCLPPPPRTHVLYLYLNCTGSGRGGFGWERAREASLLICAVSFLSKNLKDSFVEHWILVDSFLFQYFEYVSLWLTFERHGFELCR